MATSGINGASSASSSQNKSGNDALRDVNLDDFLKLMISELQNQDPLNPMDNGEILQQISQIRAVSATDKLSDTLDSVLLGQSLSNASALIGKQIKGLSDAATQVNGTVDYVSLSNGVAKLHVGDDVVSLNNVGEILAAAE